MTVSFIFFSFWQGKNKAAGIKRGGTRLDKNTCSTGLVLEADHNQHRYLLRHTDNELEIEEWKEVNSLLTITLVEVKTYN